MNERKALLKAICDNPDEDTPRLVFADWLDENGEAPGPAGRAGSSPGAGSGADRAEFIRLQIEIAGLPDGKKKQKLQVREKELLDANQKKWAKPLRKYYAAAYSGTYAHHYDPPVVFRRGFVEVLAMDADGLIADGDAVFALSPIREVRFQECSGFSRLAKSELLLRLRALDLSGSVLSTQGSDTVALLRSKYLVNLTALIARGIGDNGHMDAGGLRALAGSQHLPKLERLDLSDNWFFGESVSPGRETACRNLLWVLGEKMPSLRELRLEGVGMRDADVSGLAAQPWATRLRVLDLRSNSFGEPGCRALCESKHLANLERLVLTGNEYYDDAAGTFVPLDAATKKLLKARFGKQVVV